MFEIAVVVVSIPFFAHLIWEFVCTRKAAFHKAKVIELAVPMLVTDFDRATALIEDLEKVDLDDHINRLMRFQDPFDLYAPELCKFMREYVG